MNVIVLMLPLAITLGAGFLLAFLAALNADQFEDLETPAHRMLSDDKEGDERS